MLGVGENSRGITGPSSRRYVTVPVSPISESVDSTQTKSTSTVKKQ